MFRHLRGYSFPIPVDKYQRAGLLYHMSIFKFIGKHQIVFQNVRTILYPHQQWMAVPIVPHSHQYLVLSVFWLLAILIGVK